MAEIDNPFDRLDPEVLEDLGIIVRARSDVDLGLLDKNSDEYKSVLAVEQKLLKNGVDVKGLLAKAEALRLEVERRGTLVNQDLAGKVIRMPGYALPLEQSADGVTEFLLVPYVGACIHVPPPPANQIVFVSLSTPYKINNLYEPVWITGRMNVEAASRNLSFVDGAAPVQTGYRIDGVAVTPYESE